jgi:opacity protein-like surface antigen
MPRALVALALALAALLAAPRAARAQDRNPRPYAGFSGFLVQLEDDDVVAPSGSLRLEPDDGFGFAAALGAAAPTGGRVEIEAAFRTSDLARACAAVCAAAGGRTESLSLLFNALYDLPTGSSLRPYLGVGAGAALVSFDSADVGADGDDIVFAYQFLAGVGWQVSRSLTLVGGYRYFATTDATIDGLDIDYRSHNFEAGVRVGF